VDVDRLGHEGLVLRRYADAPVTAFRQVAPSQRTTMPRVVSAYYRHMVGTAGRLAVVPSTEIIQPFVARHRESGSAIAEMALKVKR